MTELTRDELLLELDYDPSNGVFTWKTSRGRGVSATMAGNIAGGYCSQGYGRIKVLGRSYKAHRLAWLFVHGTWPLLQVDHINGMRGDNRIANLREASIAQNGQNRIAAKNSMSRLKGASWNKARQNWQSRIRVNGKSCFLGEFSTAKEAHDAYCIAATFHFGEFANHGNSHPLAHQAAISQLNDGQS